MPPFRRRLLGQLGMRPGGFGANAEPSLASGFDLDPRRYQQAVAFGDQTDAIDQSLGNVDRPQPRGFWAKLAGVAPDAIATSLAESFPSDQGSGAERFLSGLGRGFLGGRARESAANAEAMQREALGQKLKMDLLKTTLDQRDIDLRREDLEFRRRPKPIEPDFSLVSGLDAEGHPRQMFIAPNTGTRVDTGLAPEPKGSALRTTRPIPERDPITGAIRYRDPETGAVRFSGKVSPKETSQDERTAASQYERLSLLNETLNTTAPPKGFAGRIEQLRRQYGDDFLIERAYSDKLLSDEDQAYITAASLFGAAVGYLESGKALTVQEVKRLMNVIDTDADGPQTRALKRKLRDRYIGGALRQAGRAGMSVDDGHDEDGNPYAD